MEYYRDLHVMPSFLPLGAKKMRDNLRWNIPGGQTRERQAVIVARK
jgi:hypothetical protein